MEPQLLPVQASQNLFPTDHELKTLKEMGTMFIKSGLLPKAVDTPEKAILIMMKGRELGLPPLQALSGIYVVEGKPIMGAELMLSQIYKNVPGAKIRLVQNDNTGCVVEASRPGSAAATFSFTIEDAQRAGLMSKNNWKSYPAQMCRWRAISQMAKAVFPDALSNCYSPDELGLEVDASGNITNVPATDGQKANEIASMIGAKPAEKEIQAEVIPIPTAPVTPKIETGHDFGSYSEPSTILPGQAVFLEPEPSIDPPETLGEPVSEAAHPLDSYVIEVGAKYKGKTFKEVGVDEVDRFAKSTHDWFTREKKPHLGKWPEFFNNAQEWVTTKRQQGEKV